MADNPTTRRRGRPVRVTRADVVEAATRMLATDGGADTFSMRKLADELGASTAAVYYHFPGKAQVIIAVLSARADQLPRPDLPADPRERLLVIVNHLLEVLNEQPWVVELLVGGESFGRAALWIVDEFLKAAIELGASDRYATYMYGAIWRFILGDLMMRRAEDERAAADTPPPRWSELAEPADLAAFDTLQRVLPEWAAVRVEYRSSTAAAHFIDGLLLGIG